MYVCSVYCTINHFQLLFCMFLHHELIQNKTKQIKLRHQLWTVYLLDGDNKDGNHSWSHGHTYPMARAIGEATTQQRGFICRCHFFYCLLTRSPCVSLVTHYRGWLQQRGLVHLSTFWYHLQVVSQHIQMVATTISTDCCSYRADWGVAALPANTQ